MFRNQIFNIYICKKDLALNNLQWLICHKTKPNQTKVKEPCLPCDLFIAGGGIIGFMTFPRVLMLCEMQTALFRI